VHGDDANAVGKKAPFASSGWRADSSSWGREERGEDVATGGLESGREEEEEEGKRKQ
jgi:hypothetical protein